MKKVVFPDKICLNCQNPFNRKVLPSGRLEGTNDFKIRKYCCHQCFSESYSGPNHPRYKKEGSKRSDGYIRMTVDGQRKYKHRLLMEQKLGRKLKTNEHVHHVDSNNENNILDNLELTSNSKHRKLHAKTQKRNQLGRFV